MKRDQEETGWVPIGLALAAVLLAVGIWWTAVTSVTLPLLIPLLGGGAALWLGCLYASGRNALRLEREARHAIERPVVRPPSATELLGDLRAGYRIGDAERDTIMDALRTHYAAGRLDKAELDERLAAALTARTLEDLRPVLAGLPDERTGR